MRVRQLLSEGSLDGHKSGSIWLVKESSVGRRLRASHATRRRPMCVRMLNALIEALDDDSQGRPSSDSGPRSGPLGSVEAGRLRKYLRHLQADPAPARLLRDWAGSHEQMRAFRYEGDAADLLEDARVSRTGFSHPIVALASSGQVDLRCAEADVDDLISDYLLINDADPNVFLHYSTAGSEPGLGTVLVDLAAHAGNRDDEEVRRLVQARFHD